MWKYLFTLVLCSGVLSSVTAVQRVVDEINGHNCLHCLINSSIPCKTLDYALNGSHTSNGTRVFLQSSYITLTSTIKLIGLANISIRGSCTDKPTIDCSEVWTSTEAFGAGFSLRASASFTLSCVAILHCGAAQTLENGSLYHLPFRSAMYFANVADVTLSFVDITSSNGIALVMSTVRGIVNVTNCVFDNNTAWPEYDTSASPRESFKFVGGGAIYLKLNENSTNNSKHYFHDCHFRSNQKRSDVPDAVQYTHIPNGGGILLAYENNNANSSTEFYNCTFSDNFASWGGGMYIGFVDSVRNNVVSIVNSRFQGNHATYRGGGGLDIGFHSFSYKRPAQNNTVIVKNCLIERNTAYYGGGNTVYSDLPPKGGTMQPNHVKFSNCSWLRNSAKYSAAVDVSPNVYDNLAGGFPLKVTFAHCNFIGNCISSSAGSTGNTKYDFGSGAFLITVIDVKFMGRTVFSGNYGTALQVVSASAIFEEQSYVTFLSNSGIKGGGVSLVGLAYLQFEDNSYFEFVNNSAQLVGGAIYSYSIDQHDYYFSSRTCFLRYSRSGINGNYKPNNTTFSFDSNEAKSKIGHSLFATTLKPCRQYSFTKCQDEVQAEKLLNCSIANFFFRGQDQHANIATIAQNFTTSSNGLDYGQVISMIPGKTVSLCPTVLDEFNNDVTSITVFHSYLASANSSIQFSRQYEYSPTGTVQFSGSPSNAPSDLVIQTNDITAISITLRITMDDCPPGFLLKDNKCKCGTNSYNGLTRCNATAQQAYIMEGYWAGYVNSSSGNASSVSLYTAYCPLGYCVYNGTMVSGGEQEELEHALPGAPNQSELDVYICGSTRTGKLCGQCRTNYSVSYHSRSYTCIPDTSMCEYGLLLYVVSDILPVTLLFIFVLVFDFSFTVGSVNGFIFFAQIVGQLNIETRSIAPSLPKSKVPALIYEAIYSIFNLEFLNMKCLDLSFCLWKGATALDVMVIKYATIVYALVLVVCIVFLMDYCRCYRMYKCLRNRNIGTSVVQGLSAFLIICYSQCVRVSFEILRFSPLEGYNETDYVVFQSGHLSYFGPKHLMYAIPALICTCVIIVPLPIVLLTEPMFSQIVSKYSRYTFVRKMNWLLDKHFFLRFKPIFDSFQGCFKDNFRCFAGLYLLYRILFVALQNIFGSLPEYYIVCGFLLSLILVLHCVLQPYQVVRHNIIDTLLFVNLFLINYTSLYSLLTSYSFGKLKAMKDIPLWLQQCLLFGPIVYFALYMAYFAVKKCQYNTSSASTNCNRDWPARLLLSEEYTSDESD